MYEPYKTAESRVETHDSRFDHEFKTRKHFHKFMREWARKTSAAKPEAQKPDLLDALITEGEYSNE